MALISIFTHFLFLFVFFKLSLSADPSPSFSYHGFSKASSFNSNLALFGDAKVVNATSSTVVQLTGSANLSAGRLMFKRAIKFVEGKPQKPVSFSTYFSFSISPENGDGLAFIMVPIGLAPFDVFGNSSFGLPNDMNNSESRVFAVEFDTRQDDKYGDLNDNHVGIDVGSLVSVRVMSLSSINLVLNSGKRSQCWIDYDGNLEVLEIRLSQFGNKRPFHPSLAYPINFSQLWEEELFVGFSSSNRNSNQSIVLYSWSFKIMHAMQWMHSEPLDPTAYVKKTEPFIVEKRSACVLRIATALIFGAGCGALGALAALFVWTICGNKRPVVPENLTAVHPVEYDYKKIELVLDKDIKDGSGTI